MYRYHQRHRKNRQTEKQTVINGKNLCNPMDTTRYLHSRTPYDIRRPLEWCAQG